MQVLYPRCAGLDVHKDMLMARVRCVSDPPHDEVRSFGTTTSALLELSDWLAEHAVTHVAMEATGVYWKPIWHLLEEHFELVLADSTILAARSNSPRKLHEQRPIRHNPDQERFLIEELAQPLAGRHRFELWQPVRNVEPGRLRAEIDVDARFKL